MEQNTGIGQIRIRELEKLLAVLQPQFDSIVSSLPEGERQLVCTYLSVSAELNGWMMHELYRIGKE